MPGSPVIEYALRVWWADGVRLIPANDVEHAEEMKRTVYAARRCEVVKRTLYITPWEPVKA